MKLPLIIVSYLPKKYKDRYIQKQWDNKSDDSIMIAFNDAVDWMQLASGSMATPTIKDIARDCENGLLAHIKPQMIKRGLR